jgi:hypothetical protein
MRASPGLCGRLTNENSLIDIMQGGYIVVYRGEYPGPYDPTISNRIATVTTDGDTYSDTGASSVGGLSLSPHTISAAVVDSGTWVLTALMDGTPSWWRFYGPKTDSDDIIGRSFIDGLVEGDSLNLPAYLTAGQVISPISFMLYMYG